MNTKVSFTRQGGAALFTALIFLIVITMLSLTAMRSSMLELRMASNQESKAIAFQRAQAVVDAAVGIANNMPTLSDVNATNCMDTDPQANNTAVCTTKGVKLDQDYLADYVDAGKVYARVTRLAPLEQPAPRAIGTSAAIYSVATFQVDGTYDLSDIGQGRAQIREGLMLLIAK